MKETAGSDERVELMLLDVSSVLEEKKLRSKEVYHDLILYLTERQRKSGWPRCICRASAQHAFLAVISLKVYTEAM